MRDMSEGPAVMTASITAIRRAEIPAQGLQLDLCWDAALLAQLPEDSCRDIEPPLHVQLRFRPEGGRIIMDGTCRAQCRIACVRCLERFEYPLTRSFRYVFQLPGMHKAAGNVQLGAEDIETVGYDGDQIDLIAPVLEQVYLGLPAYPHCSSGCRGLCPQCGGNLNTGACACSAATGHRSPFAVLGTLKKRHEQA